MKIAPNEKEFADKVKPFEIVITERVVILASSKEAAEEEFENDPDFYTDVGSPTRECEVKVIRVPDAPKYAELESFWAGECLDEMGETIGSDDPKKTGESNDAILDFRKTWERFTKARDAK